MSNTGSGAPKNGGLGCLGYGCLVAVVLLLLILGALFLGVRYAARNAVGMFTTDGPVAVPTAAFDEGAESAASEKLDQIRTLFSDPKASGNVVISQREIGGVIRSTPFNGRAFLEMQGDSVKGTFSFPLSALGSWGAAQIFIGDLVNRYATGEATFKFSVKDGSATITMVRLVLNGQNFDADSLTEAGEWISGCVNFLKQGDSEVPALKRISSARVENGQLLIQVRAD